MNKSLRMYVERVTYGRKSELDRLLARFNKQYNNSPHRGLASQTPLDILSLNADEIKIEKKRQIVAGQKRVGSKRTPKIEVGATVRMYIVKNAEKKGGRIGHQGEKPMWSKTIFVVIRRVGSSRGDFRYKLKPINGSALPSLYFGDKLQVVKIPKYKSGKKNKHTNEIKQIVMDADKIDKLESPT